MIQPHDERQVLRQAREQAERLLAELEAQQAELQQHPPKLPAEELSAGQAAMADAVAAARRTATALRDAENIADLSDLDQAKEYSADDHNQRR